MATKTITGDYPGGFSLDPSYSTLEIAHSATVEGSGVTTSNAARSTILNLGKVQGTGNGITLSDGGAITNGSSSNSSALIEGENPITVSKGAGTLTNWGTVTSDQTSAQSTVFKYNYYYNDQTTSQAVSVTMNAGGSVTNESGARIGNGVSLTSGTVTNNGSIGASVDTFSEDRYSAHRYSVDDTTKYASGLSVSLTAGGRVTNGATSNTNAQMSSGVEIDGAKGTVSNFGTIGTRHETASYHFYYYKIGYASVQSYDRTSASVVLTAGGSVSNLGSSASLGGGISIAGGSGAVVNEGSIAGSSSNTYKHFEAASSNRTIDVGPSVALAAGGSVTNRASGTIGNGIEISGGAGTISNLGTIAGTVGYSATKSDGASVASTSTHDGYSITLAGTGSIVNAASGNIVNGIKLGGAGKISNLGAIGPTRTDVYSASTQQTTTTYGFALDLLAGGSVTNGSASVTNALIHGTVHTEGGAATITNFGTIAGGTAGLDLQDNATVINGSAKDTNAVITGAVGIQTGTGTVQIKNFGVIQGTGDIAVSFGASTQTLIEEGSGTLAGTVEGHGGTLELGAAAGAGSLTGLGNSFLDFAKLVVDAGSAWTLHDTNAFLPTALASTVSLTNSGTLTNTGAFQIGGQIVNGGTITNASGATFDIAGDYGIGLAASIKGTLNNAGTLEKISGTGTSLIRTGSGTLTDTGTINVATGTLELSGYAIKISGALKGNGTIEFGPGTATLSSGTSLDGLQALLVSGTGAVMTVTTNLSDAGSVSVTANGTLAVGSGDIFTLSGAASFARAKVAGSGELLTTGATALNTVTLGGTAQWVNAGTVMETGALTMGDAANRKVLFTNQATGRFNLVGNVGITLAGAATSSFVNQGLLAKTSGPTSVIGVAVANSGTVEVASGTLDLQKAVSGTGTLKIDAGKILQADAAVAKGQTVLFGGGNDRLVLTDASDFAGTLANFGSADRLDLTQFATAGTTLSFVENAKNTGGTLTVTNGSAVANIAMSGQYTTAGFAQASDGKGGDLVTYKAPAAMAQTSMSRSSMSMAQDSLAMALFEAASAPSANTDHIAPSFDGQQNSHLAADPLGPKATHFG